MLHNTDSIQFLLNAIITSFVKIQGSKHIKIVFTTLYFDKGSLYFSILMEFTKFSNSNRSVNLSDVDRR